MGQQSDNGFEVDDEPEFIDHQFTDEVVCPHCGAVHCAEVGDWGEQGEHDCDECGEVFHYEAEFSVTWITRRIAS